MDSLINKKLEVEIGETLEVREVDNLSDLHFYGSSNDDIIYVLWGN